MDQLIGTPRKELAAVVLTGAFGYLLIYASLIASKTACPSPHGWS